MNIKNSFKNMHRITTLVLVLILILPMMSLLYSQQDHGKIVPVFDVDKSGSLVKKLVKGSPTANPTQMAKAINRGKSRKSTGREKLKDILQGAANYCERLKQSALNFYCREKIAETRVPLSSAETSDPTIDENPSTRQGYVALHQIRNKVYTKVGQKYGDSQVPGKENQPV